MKSFVYKNPVISALIIDYITIVLTIYSINQEMVALIILPPILTGIINRRIIDNGKNMNKKKKIIIYVSFFLTVSIFSIYATYVYNARCIQLGYWT